MTDATAGLAMAQVAGPGFVVVGVARDRMSAGAVDQLFLDPASAPMMLSRLRSAGIDNVVLVATCDRTEAIAQHPDPDALAATFAAVLAVMSGVPRQTVDSALHRFEGARAVERLMAIAGGIESTLPGEPEVLAQVRGAIAASATVGMVGTELDRLCQAALAFGKRVRAETAVGRHVVSIASAAVGVAREVFGDLTAASALVLGASEAAMVIAGRLRDGGLQRLTVTDPTEGRVAPMAREIGARVAPFAGFDAELAEADIVVVGIGRGAYLIDVPRVDAALRRRRRRPMFLIDVGVPADIAPDVHRLDGAFLYTLADLERIAEAGLARRREAAAEASAMAAEAATEFLLAEAERSAVPALVALRERFEAVRAELLSERPGLSADEATRLLIARLLHQPALALKALARGNGAEALDGPALVRMIARLFGNRAPGGTSPKTPKENA
jgi:glutamyl-tRNA reductase